MPRIDPFAPITTKKRPIPFDFVLEQLAPLTPTVRAMFGSTGVYLDERVVFILRQKHDVDDGVWVCFEPELEAEVLALFPTLQRIEVLGNVRAWRKLSASSETFEDDVLRACKLLVSGDQRLGKLPDRLKAKKKKGVTPARSGASKKPRAR
jgi:hypothetical protein